MVTSWLSLMKQAVDGQDPRLMLCPVCNATGVDVFCHVALPESEMGYCLLRCATNGHGWWLSRTRVPPHLVSSLPREEWPAFTLGEDDE